MDNMLTWNSSGSMYNNSEGGSPLSVSSSTDEDADSTTTTITTTTTGGFKLASANPKKRTGRKKFNETRHPVFRGVRQRSSGKWVCEVREPKKKNRIWLGTFLTPEMAARAHDVAAMALRGSSATLNFADSPWRLPVLPASSDTKDIQRAAAEAAYSFRPQGDVAVTGDNVSVADVAVAPGGMQPYREEQGVYMDDDAVFGMAGLVADMYQGMMLPPPPGGASYDDDVESYADVPLWSYSF